MRGASGPSSARVLASGLRVGLLAGIAATVFVLWVLWPTEPAPTQAGLHTRMSVGSFSSAVQSAGSVVRSATAAVSSAGSDAASAFASRGHGGKSWVERRLCTDTCARANDGVCNDGRRSPTRGGGGGSADGPFTVECDLGTDCSDCGPWLFSGPREALSWAPVKEIQDKKFQLNVRRTATPVPFFMTYTDPAADVDVSGQMARSAMIEPGLTWVWHRLLSEGCTGVNGERALVLDVGANFGYYSLMSAAMGCHVIAWEPVPYFAAFFKYGLLRNNLTGAVELREAVVSDQHGAELTLVVPSTGIWGTAGIGGKNLDPGQRAAATDSVKKRAERVDRVVPPQEVLLMKVDVEGFEPSVLASAKNLLLKGDVRNVIMEYSPGVTEINAEWKAGEENPGKLLGLARAGYTILHMDEPFRVLTGFNWSDALPAMPSVPASALQHDIEDTRLLQEGKHGCPLPPEVLAAGGMWDCPGPYQVERLHPQGFRPTFGYNTNVWAFKGQGGGGGGGPGVEGPPATLFPPDFDMRDYFSPHNRTYPTGHRLRACSEEPPQYQVKFRCRCSNSTVCGEQERAVLAAVQRGAMPPLPLDRPVQAAAYDVANW